MKKILIFIIFLITSSPSKAQEYTLNQIIDLAIANSSNIKSADLFTNSQKHFANQQKYWQNPTFKYGNNRQTSSYEVNQTIPFYNKLDTKFEIEFYQAKILENRRENLANFIKAEVFSLLYQYHVLKNKIFLTEKRLNRLNSVDQYLSHIALNSPTKRAQGLITKDRLRLIERDLITYKNQILQIWNKINIYTNLNNPPQKILIKWLEPNNFNNRQFYIDKVINQNLDLKEQKILLEKFKSELEFAKIEQMPDVNIALSRQNNLAQSNNAEISIAIPIINRNQEKIIGEQAKISAQKFELEFQTNQLIKSISNNIIELEYSLEISKNLSPKNIEKILKNLQIANNDFKRGTLDFITYIELDIQEYQMIDAILENQMQIADSFANLSSKIGEFILPK